MESRIVLVDMDGVIADFETGFLETWRQTYPSMPYVSLEERTSPKISDDYERLSAGLGELALRLMHSSGFYRHLPVIPGVAEAISGMLARHLDVRVCSRPSFANPTCLQDKRDWMEDNFGLEIAKRLILTTDKTLISGDILIDDYPQLGVLTPSWRHVIFTAPYNIRQTGVRLSTWYDWETVIIPLLVAA